jgi:hypothetical protein
VNLLLVYYGWTNPDNDTQLPLFRELAKRLTFLYVQEPVPFRGALRKRSRQSERDDGLFHLEPVSILPFGRRSGVLRLNYLRGGLRATLSRFKKHRRVVMACRPKMHILKGMVEEDVFVYDCYDDYIHFKWKPAEQDIVRSEEKTMLKEADAAFCTANTLVEKCRAVNPNTFKVPLGVDFELFSNPRNEPEDVCSIPHPRIGTIGKFNRRIDVDLIGGIASAKPEWSIALVGPVFSQDPGFDRAFEGMVQKYSNVHHLGGKPYETLPDYLDSFDVAIVPYALGDVTLGISPLKLFQFCAQGKPTVVTPVPEVADLTDIAFVAEGAEEFVAAIEKALDEDNADVARKRVEYARANTWSSRADQVMEIFDKLIGDSK